ncbi:MAG: F0F1 ATP synthase subunit delta [Actinomycetales bacterium]|nr:F0F1 ATP synthase subunit delta [Actinomycetales bacterium]
MRATSQDSLAAAKDRWESVLDAAGDRANAYGHQLFTVVDTLDSSPALRRALTEPTREGADKAAVVTQLFGGKLDDVVVDLVAGMVRSRWSSERDISDVVNVLALTSFLASAQARGELARVEEEIFRIVRILAGNRDLRLALADRDLPASNRLAVIDAVFGDRIATDTGVLVRRAIGSLRFRSITSALTMMSELAAERRKRLLAIVTAASPLTQAQQDRLRELLQRVYSREVQVNLALDPDVVGGLRIQIGDDVMDATMLSRLDEARRRLAG